MNKETKQKIIDLLEQYGFSDKYKERDILSIYFAITSPRFLRSRFFSYPDLVLEDLFSSETDSNLFYMPSDVVEFRAILKKEYMPAIRVLYSLKFAKKYLQEYPILLCFEKDAKDVKNTKECKIIGNLLLDNSPQDFDPIKIRRVLLSSSLSREQKIEIKKIINEEKVNTDIEILSDAPEISEAIKMQATSKWNLMKEAASLQDVKITIDPTEQKIFAFLRQSKNAYPELSPMEMRVVGGWVRDKAIGKESKDIDIALSHITGLDFVQKIKEYDEKTGGRATGKIHSTSLLKVKDKNAIIPESAKLEVAAIEIFGEPIEFVSLRTEIYNEESRTPIASPTNDPSEDARRRDFSINSLYYNIETGQVEDYVGALQDFDKNPSTGFLVPKILRTSGDSVKTFEEDPLRILRALRFFARFPGISLDPEMVLAFSNPQVQSKYKKLAPERASSEIRKIMQATDAVKAVEVLFDTDLYKLVFGTPEDWHPINLDQKNPHHNLSLKDHILGVMRNMAEMAKEANIPPEERGLLLLSAMFHDFGKMSPQIRKPKIDKETGLPNENHYHYVGHEQVSADFAKKVMNNMAFEPHEKKFVETVTRNHMIGLNFDKPTGREKDMKPEKRSRMMGRFFRDTGDLWEYIIKHSLADTLSKENLSQEDIEATKQRYNEGLGHLQQYRQEIGPYFGKPLIDGNRIKQIILEVAPDLSNSNGFILEKGKPIHFLKYAIEKLIEQQQMRRIKTVEEAEQYVRKNARGWQGLWMQQEKEKEKNKQKGNDPKMASNWYKKITKADASSSEGPEGFGYEQQTPLERTEDIVRPKPQRLERFREGAKVRLHRDSNAGGSLWGEHTTGIIKSINGSEMTVEWQTGKYKGKITHFDINDPLKINLMIDVLG